MEYLAGFYIVLGFLIIITKSEFLKNKIYKPIIDRINQPGKDRHVELKPSFPVMNRRMELQKVPVIVKNENPFQGRY